MKKLSGTKIIKRKFYQRDTLHVAQNLLGCFLIRKIGRKIIRGTITETEAYIGEEDLACHASRGRTPRTEIMYGQAGHAYIYMIYGMYHCLNIVTERKNFPAAALIRGVKLIKLPVTFRAKGYRGKKGSDEMGEIEKLDGPGKVCQYFKIDKRLNRCDLTKKEKLWVEQGVKVKKSKIKKSKRIGIDYAKHCKHYLWRFYLETENDD